MTDSPVVSPPVQDKAPNYSVIYTLRVTEEMDQQLQSLLTQQERPSSRNDLLRTAIQAYIDAQGGKNGHPPDFKTLLQQQMELHDSRNHLYMDILIFMQARCFANILAILERNTQLQSTDFIRRAVETAFKEGPVLNGQLHYEQDRVDWIVAKKPKNAE